MISNTDLIRTFILDHFDEQTFRELCFDYFREVHNELTNGMRKRQMVQILLEYCELKNQTPLLINLLQSKHSKPYGQQFASGQDIQITVNPAESSHNLKYQQQLAPIDSTQKPIEIKVANSNFYMEITWSCSLLGISERRLYPTVAFEKLTIGSGENNDITLTSKLVSHHHAQIIKRNSDFAIEDTGSKNGIAINGKIHRQSWVIDDLQASFEIRPFTFNVTLIPVPLRYTIGWQNQENGKEKQVEGLELPVTIGRDPSNDLVLPDKIVSRYHAYIEIENHQLMYLDKASKYGSFVNGIKRQKAALGPDDDIRIGPYAIHLSPFISEGYKKTDYEA